MTRNSSKSKGDRGELELQGQLRELTGWPVRRKLGAGRADDTGDLDGLPGPTTAQVKNYKNITRAINEGLQDLDINQTNSGDPYGVVFVRRPGGRWIAVQDLPRYVAQLREATQPEADGHVMRDIWEDSDGWNVICECGFVIVDRYRHDAVDAWHAHRDEEQV